MQTFSNLQLKVASMELGPKSSVYKYFNEYEAIYANITKFVPKYGEINVHKSIHRNECKKFYL